MKRRRDTMQPLRLVWDNWTGGVTAFSMEQRLYHSASLLFVAILVAFAFINAGLGFWPSAWISAATAVAEILLFILSRFGGMCLLSAALNGLLSYLALILNYQFNSGIDGPSLILFILTFQVLLIATPRSWQGIWAAGHLLVAGTLFYMDQGSVDFAPNGYATKGDRVIDHFTTFCLVLFALYFLSAYILRQYQQQRRLAEDRAEMITEKNRALLRSEGQLQAFFQNATDSHILMDEKLRVLAFNREAGIFFRRTRAFTLSPGVKALDGMPAGDARRLEALCLDALEGEPQHLELALPQSSGGLWWWRFSAGPAHLADGSRLGVVLSAISVQERVQHEAQIRAQSATLVQIANLHAHALRGPAASILGLVKLVRELGYKATAEDMELLQQAAETLDARIHEIVALTGERRADARGTPAAESGSSANQAA